MGAFRVQLSRFVEGRSGDCRQMSHGRDKSAFRSLRFDPTLFWTALSSVAALLAASFAGWAAWETRKGALEAGRATRATLWLQLLSEYSQSEMLESMSALRDWQRQNPADFADKCQALLVKSDKTDAEKQTVRALDGHRRRVSSFFEKVWVLTEGGILDEEFVRATWGRGGTYTYMNDVLFPMERAKASALVKTGSLTADDIRRGAEQDKGMREFYKRITPGTANQ